METRGPGRTAAAIVVAFFLSVVTLPSPRATGSAGTTLAPVNLEPIQIAQGVETDGSGPDLAFDGTNFLVVWYSPPVVYGALISPDGAIMPPGVIVIDSDNGYRPSVAFDGTNFLVAWTDWASDPDSSRQILAARVDTTGVVLDPAPIVVGSDAKLRRISVAFDGANYMTVWRTSSDSIQAGRVSTSGVALDGSGFAVAASSSNFYPWVTYAAGQYLVAWHVNGVGLDVKGAFVAPDTTVTGPFTIFTGAGDQDHVSVATDGTDFLVTWRDSQLGNQANLGGAVAARVAADGTVLDDPPIVVSELEWAQGTKRTVSFDGTDYIVVWSEYHYPVKHRLSDIYARRISTSGEIIDSDPIPIATGMQHQTGPTVGVAGDRYLFAFYDGGELCSWPSTCLHLRLSDRVAASTTAVVGSPGTATEVGTWDRITSPVDAPIHTVWAFGDDSAFAATEPDNSPLLEWDGSDWSIATYLPNARKYGMWGSSPAHLFTIGGAGHMPMWDGTTATIGGNLFPTITDPLTRMGTSVKGFGEWSIYFAGVDGVVARHFGTDQDSWENGACLTLDGAPSSYWGKWDCDHIRGPLDNWDVWGTSPDDVYVVGEFGTLAHFDGSEWSLVPVPTAESLNGVWSSCAGDVYAVGDFGTILHFDGSTWTRMASPTTQHLFSVAGFASDDVYAVGNTGTILHFDGAGWSEENSGTDNTLEDVAVGESVVWVTGSRDDDEAGIGQGTILQKQRTITDATSPTNPLLVSHTHPTGVPTSSTTVEVDFEAGCDDGRGISGYSVALDGNPTTVPAPTQNLEGTETSFTGAATDGESYFHLRTVDRAGNWSGASHLGPFVVDTSPPDTTIDSGPSGTVGSADAEFTFSSTEGGSTFECRLDGGAFSPCVTPKAYSGLADGSHGFAVRATDVAGSTDPSPAGRTWTVDTTVPDTTPPDTIIDSGPSGTVSDPDATFTFHATEDATFACRLDEGAWVGCTSPQTYPGLAVGAHTFQVRATDAAANTDATPATRSWTISSGEPTPTTLSINLPAKVPAGTRARITGTLASVNPTCADTQDVFLKRGSSTFGPKLTDGTGHYRFRTRITKKTVVQVTFAGTATCSASSSTRKTIKVT